MLIEFLKANIDEELLLDKHDRVKLADVEYSNDIIFDKKITFQGKLIPLKKIINDMVLLDEKMDSTTLEKFLDNKLEIAPAPTQLKTYQKEFYINRQLGPIKIDAKLVETCQGMEHNFFVFENIRATEITNLLKICEVYENQICSMKEFLETNFDRKKQYIYSDSCLSYYEENQLSKKLTNMFHILTVEKSSYVEKEKYVYVNEMFFLYYTKNNKVVLLIDSAGIGKSTTLSYFIENYTEALWILRINLIESAEVFSKLNEICLLSDKEFIFNYSNKVINYETLLLNSLINLTTSNKSPKTFENYIFDYMFKNNKVLILFDGYDEIDEKSRKGLLSCIQRLKEKTNNSIWLTSRSNFKEEMEDELHTSGYSFKPLSSFYQRQLLINIWTQQWEKELSIGQKHHMDMYAATLIQNFSENKIALTSPLQLKMLAEIFMQNNDSKSNWVGCFNFIENDQMCDDFFSRQRHRKIEMFDKTKNLHALYDEFVRKKIKKYFERVFGSSCDTATGLKQPLFEECHNVHCVLALKTMTDQDELFDIIKLEEPTEFAYHDVGLVSSMGKQQVFVHFSYAEYFSAYFLFQKLMETPEKREKIFSIVGHILKNDVPVFSYCMKHLMWNNANNYTTTDLIKDINLSHYKDKFDQYAIIKWMLNDANYDHSFPKIDKIDKTYLHYTVESENLPSVVYALLHFYSLLFRHEKTCSELIPAILLDRMDPFMNLLILRNVSAKTTLFYLAEYIKFKDKMGNSALFYAKKNTKITALFEDIIRVADKCDDAENENYDIKHTLEIVPKQSKRYELANILSKKIETVNIFQNIFCSLSFSSMYLILETVEPAVLDLLLEKDSKGYTFFDNICVRNDITIEENHKLFEIWWNESMLKKKALNSILLASIVNNCGDIFNHFVDFIKHTTRNS